MGYQAGEHSATSVSLHSLAWGVNEVPRRCNIITCDSYKSEETINSMHYTSTIVNHPSGRERETNQHVASIYVDHCHSSTHTPTYYWIYSLSLSTIILDNLFPWVSRV